MLITSRATSTSPPPCPARRRTWRPDPGHLEPDENAGPSGPASAALPARAETPRTAVRGVSRERLTATVVLRSGRARNARLARRGGLARGPTGLRPRRGALVCSGSTRMPRRTSVRQVGNAAERVSPAAGPPARDRLPGRCCRRLRGGATGRRALPPRASPAVAAPGLWPWPDPTAGPAGPHPATRTHGCTAVLAGPLRDGW
ncbi:hypothetical protein QJS66_22235 [Kocuria rhizophila]|nr:hypothetical protein QJS66_22235 [Kocuria rhizophila]